MHLTLVKKDESMTIYYDRYCYIWHNKLTGDIFVIKVIVIMIGNKKSNIISEKINLLYDRYNEPIIINETQWHQRNYNKKLLW